MGLGCGARCLKFCLFIFNLVFLMCGFVCVGIGIWLLFDRYAVDNLAAATAKVQGNVTDDGLRELFERDFRQILKASLKMYNGTDAMKKHEDNTKLCCGVDSKIGDFNESGWYQLTKRLHHFPPACCPPTKDGSLMEFCPTISRYGDGCYAKIKESVQDLSTHFKIVAWTVCIIALIQVFSTHRFL
uniref:Tetraspanin n=1 Tax=Parascaris equorum TaxID=6256 RepID=A0A914S1B5_PAREQ